MVTAIFREIARIGVLSKAATLRWANGEGLTEDPWEQIGVLRSQANIVWI